MKVLHPMSGRKRLKTIPTEMDANCKKTCRPGVIPCSSDEIITVQIVKDEPPERKILDKPIGLAIIELASEDKPDDPTPRFKVVWCNDYHSNRFPNLKGSICYKEVNEFDCPCKWCPVKNTFRDGLLHISLAASPVKRDFPNITYSEIVSVPYAYDQNAQVRQVLEMVFDFRDEQLEQFRDSLAHYEFGNQLADLLQSADDREEAVDLVLFGLLMGLQGKVDIAHALLVGAGAESLENAEIEEHRELMKSDIPSDISNKLLNTHDLSQIRGMVMSRIRGESKKKRVGSLFDEKERGQLRSETWKPMRLGHRKLGVLIPRIDDQTDCLLVLEAADQNSLVFDSVFSSTAVLTSAFRRVLTVREREAAHNIEYDNLKKKLDTFHDSRGDLIELIPFVLGKAHNVSIILGKQQSLLHTLRHLKRGQAVSDIKADLLCVLEETTSELKWLYDSMRTVRALGIVQFKEVNIVEVVKSSFEVFAAEFARERIILELYKVRGRIDITCDPGLVKQVLINLADNSRKSLLAVKGRARIISVAAENVENGVRILFEDNGGGIHPDDKRRIFQRYFSTRYGGTGLGLYFSKKIVEVHGGKIDVESKWGQYARFEIFLPRVPSSYVWASEKQGDV